MTPLNPKTSAESPRSATGRRRAARASSPAWRLRPRTATVPGAPAGSPMWSRRRRRPAPRPAYAASRARGGVELDREHPLDLGALERANRLEVAAHRRRLVLDQQAGAPGGGDELEHAGALLDEGGESRVQRAAVRELTHQRGDALGVAHRHRLQQRLTVAEMGEHRPLGDAGSRGDALHRRPAGLPRRAAPAPRRRSPSACAAREPCVRPRSRRPTAVRAQRPWGIVRIWPCPRRLEFVKTLSRC